MVVSSLTLRIIDCSIATIMEPPRRKLLHAVVIIPVTVGILMSTNMDTLMR
jgi:hypothetical protein